MVIYAEDESGFVVVRVRSDGDVEDADLTLSPETAEELARTLQACAATARESARIRDEADAAAARARASVYAKNGRPVPEDVARAAQPRAGARKGGDRT